MIKDILQGKTSPGALFFCWFLGLEAVAGCTLITIVVVYFFAWEYFPSPQTAWQIKSLIFLIGIIPIANFAWVAVMIRAFWRATGAHKTNAFLAVLGLASMIAALVLNARLLPYAYRILFGGGP